MSAVAPPLAVRRISGVGSEKRTKDCSPTLRQVDQTAQVVRWYVRLYYGTRWDSGTAVTFCDPSQVGRFALDEDAFAAGEDRALFRLLVCVAMFQRRQDQQILRILRGMAPSAVEEVSDSRRLLQLVDRTRCSHLKTLDRLHDVCDLSKHPKTRIGLCTKNPRVKCHLKKHTVVLKRYGHFGKVPTSSALMLREAGVGGLSALRASILASTPDPIERAEKMISALSRIWRISEKIANMFLSILSNPDLSRRPPWSDGVDWTQFVVVDSNVDLFLAAIGYRGRRSYDARRRFIRSLAERINLSEHASGVRPFNPRLVQQAMYLFMSRSNRGNASIDCSSDGPQACRKCPKSVARLCSLRQE